MPAFKIIDGEQARHLLNTQQLYETLMDARARIASTKGSLGYSSVGGRQYLYREVWTAGRRSRKSMGPRTEDTDRILEAWKASKARAEERLAGVRDAMQSQAAKNRAYNIGRVPGAVADVLRSLSDAKAQAHQGGACLVLGTNALYAYEAILGVAYGDDYRETMDLDVMVDSRRKLSLAVDPDISLESIVQKADRSYERISNRSYGMVNDKGFEVEFIKATEVPPWRQAPHKAGPDDLQPAEIEQLNWFVNVPRVSTVAIDERGYPVAISAVHPLAFAIYKMWMAGQPTRNRIKARRDVAQAEIVASSMVAADYDRHLNLDTLPWMPSEAIEAARPLESILSGNNRPQDPYMPY